MKTAVSIPDPIYKAAERASKRLGVSRSRLYTMAIERLLETDRCRGVTESLNEIYRKEDSRLDPVWMAMEMTSLPPEDENW
jgi:antitoxin MazE6